MGNRKAVAPRELQDSKDIYFGAGGNDIYNKGSWIMHTLRWLLGDKKFFEALRRMAYPDPAMEKVTDGSQVRFSDTEEIRAIAEKSSGVKLDWFFEVYLRQPKLPRIIVERKGDQVSLSWDVPQGLPFPMPQDSQYYDSVNWDDGTSKPGLEHSTARVHIVSAWMPLVDTDKHNGALIVGSALLYLFALVCEEQQLPVHHAFIRACRAG